MKTSMRFYRSMVQAHNVSADFECDFPVSAKKEKKGSRREGIASLYGGPTEKSS